MSTALPDPGAPLDLPGAQLLWWPRLLPAEDASDLLAELRDELPWQQRSIRMFGKQIREPRLVSWHGDPAAHYRYSGRDNAPVPWTPALTELRLRVEAATGLRFNSVLANRYRSGSDAMGWHADDEPELGSQPAIASVSLGATRPMQFRPRPSGPIALRVELGPGSMLVMSGATQQRYHHRIPATKRPIGERVNLTFRLVGSAAVQG